MSASANALKICSTWTNENVSFESLHNTNKRATPIKMSMYKLAIQLFKLYNSENSTPDWIDLNLQQNFNGRSTKFLVSNCAKYKIGSNLLVNRLSALHNTIELSWLNLSLNSYKIKCKSLLLTQHRKLCQHYSKSKSFKNSQYFLNVNLFYAEIKL